MMRNDRVIRGNGAPIKSVKVGRNAPCPCNSGKKAKNCHGADAEYFYRPTKKDKK